jgi:hypothetical protein
MPPRAPRRAITRLVPAAAGALVLVVALTACGAPPGEEGAASVQGTGDVQTELRELPPFTRVSVAAGMKVIIGYNVEQSVSLAAQGNILPAISTEVVDGQLIVTIPPPGVEATQPMALTVRLPALESVALSAGVVGYLEHTGSGLNVDISGGVQLTAIGSTPDLRLNATTGSHARLDELVAQYAQISLNDGSTAELNVVTSVTGTATGGSTVVLAGSPAQVDIETTSGATVQGG